MLRKTQFEPRLTSQLDVIQVTALRDPAGYSAPNERTLLGEIAP